MICTLLSLEDCVQMKLQKGKNCGLVKNLALMVDVSENVPNDIVLESLEDLDIHPIEKADTKGEKFTSMEI